MRMERAIEKRAIERTRESDITKRFIEIRAMRQRQEIEEKHHQI